MSTLLLIGLGGGIGAMARYGLSLITVNSAFPFMTFITNILGALCIGIIVGIGNDKQLSKDIILPIKTGFCGGFTTFSTFSLEMLTLIQNRQYFAGISYALLSVILCIVGVYIGLTISHKICA